MQFTTLALGLATAALAAADGCPSNYNQPKPSDPKPSQPQQTKPQEGTFLLQILPAPGPGKLNQQEFLSSYHTGAARSSLVAQTDKSKSTHFIWNPESGWLQNAHGPNDVIFSVSLEGPNNDGTNPNPKGYGYVHFDAGSDGSRLSFDSDNFLQFGALEKSGTTFSLCAEHPYVPDVMVEALTFHEPGVQSGKDCADVRLKAVAV